MDKTADVEETWQPNEDACAATHHAEEQALQGGIAASGGLAEGVEVRLN